MNLLGKLQGLLGASLERRRLNAAAVDEPPAVLIDSFLAGYVTSYLKELGFKKSGRTYSRMKPEWEERIMVQADKWNRRGEVRFSFEVGIFHEPTCQAIWGPPTPGVMYDRGCQLSLRIGDVIRPHRSSDLWWHLKRSTDVAALGTEVQQALARVDPGFFAKFNTVRDIANVVSLVKTDGPLPNRMFGALYFYAGDQAKATSYLKKAADAPHYPSPKWRREAFATAQRLGLPYDPPRGEQKLVVELTASPALDAKAARKLALRAHLRLADVFEDDHTNYLHLFEDRSPVFRFTVYGPDEAELRERLAPVLEYAGRKFEGVRVEVSPA